MGDSRRTAVLLAALLMLGCSAMAPRPIEYDTSDPASAATKDGLLRLRRPKGTSAIWVRPGTSLSSFQKLAIGPSTTTYRTATQQKPNERPRDTARDPETTERISKMLGESLEREFLLSDRFSVVKGTGANILWIRGHAVNLDIDFSPSGDRRMGGRLGGVTFVLDVRDSQTGEARVRLLDRWVLRWAGRVTYTQNAAPGAWQAMEQSFSEWAHRVRMELEGLSNVETPPSPLPPTATP